MTTSRPPRSTSGARRRTAGGLAALVSVAALLAGCTDDPGPTPAGGPSGGASAPTRAACAPASLPPALRPDEVAATNTRGTTVKLVTHDSFAVSDGIFDAFTRDTGIEVQLLSSGDAGALVSQSVLTAGRPVADVLYGIDTTFLCRATKASVFVPYAPRALADVPDTYEEAPDHLLTPIDVGAVCLTYAERAFPTPSRAPRRLDDLTDPAYRDAFVTENPETSSPGFAFLLATIARYGEQGWEDYWRALRANGVKVDTGWEQAYNQSFGAGSGDRSIVTSYATSPVADVVYSDPPRTRPMIGVVPDGCFRQVEFAGVLRGTDHPEAAAKLVDYLLSRRFQEDVPLNMFVEPVNRRARVPAEFDRLRAPIDRPLTLSPAVIEAGRDRWTRRWTELVLR